jgi:hypothetical protein
VAQRVTVACAQIHQTASSLADALGERHFALSESQPRVNG